MIEFHIYANGLLEGFLRSGSEAKIPLKAKASNYLVAILNIRLNLVFNPYSAAEVQNRL